MADGIDYSHLMQRAMQGLIAQVLRQTAAEGLIEPHHFFISFATSHPCVEMADWLRERYPDEMTIVIQHWFENLTVADDHFTITLNFGNAPEPMVIPFDALRSFVDPSVEFGLRFDPIEDDEDDEIDEDDPPAPTPPEGGSKVVSLDQWRK